MIIFFAVSMLFANEGKALQAESICCEEIEALLKNKTTAYQTVCLRPDSRLSSNCCRNIEIEIEKHRYAYKTLCPAVEKPVTTGLLLNLLPLVRLNDKSKSSQRNMHSLL